MDLAVDTPTTDSTVLDPGATPQGGSGGGTPNLRDAMRDTVADAVAKASEAAEGSEKEVAAPESKPKPETAKAEDKSEPKDAKAPERGAGGKFVGKEKPAETVDAPKPANPAPEAKAEDKPDGHIPVPRRFLPDAQEKWTNVPRPVQRDIDNAFKEHETELTRYREAAERYEPIRQYDDYVRQNGRAGVHETLAEVAQLEDLMGKNPIAAVNQILQRAGPRKPDGSPVSLREFVQVVSQMDDNAYSRAVSTQQQTPQNDNPEIAQLKQQIAQLHQQQVAVSIIEPFRAANPRYDELKDDIALFLQSGKVPASLSPQERLAAAYDMAVRINPASHADPSPAEADPDPERRADEPSAATTSIKTAPGAITPVEEPKRAGTARDEVERVIRRMTQTGGR